MLGNATIRRAGALPKEPTPALPGSEEKIQIMTERAARREQLFHPLDGLAYQGRPPAPPEEADDWPFTLSRDLLNDLPAEILDDLEEDAEDLAAVKEPAYCPWTEPPCPVEPIQAAAGVVAKFPSEREGVSPP